METKRKKYEEPQSDTIIMETKGQLLVKSLDGGDVPGGEGEGD